MRYVLVLWALPLVLFWGWFGLSYYNVNFGYVLMTREAHDLIFELYGEALGIDPKTIPGLVARACMFDTFLLACLWAFRRRRQLVERYKNLRARYSRSQSVESV